MVIMDESLVDVTNIARTTVQVLKSKGVDPMVVSVKGDSIFERNIYVLMVGNYTSLYIASICGVDPCNVDAIVDLKNRMKMELENN